MKTTLISTYDTSGGAAIAASRLYKSLLKVGVKASFLVQNKKSNDPTIIAIANNWIKEKFSLFRFALDRLYFLFFEKSKLVRFAFSQANIGINIADNNLVKNADIIHLHWINFGFLSINSLKKLAALNKPIVWTLHDMWAFTGGCHYAGDCQNYKSSCSNCYNFLKNPASDDLSNSVWKAKNDLFINGNFTIVACSEWLAQKAKESSLLKGKKIFSIPNPIDIERFRPIDKLEAKRFLELDAQKKYILFASANIGDNRKGFEYLKNALNILFQTNEIPDNTELLIFGKSNETEIQNIPYKVNFLGQINDESEISKVYSAATVFVIPSLEDNLPNTIAEAMACGTPVVGFKTGGIPEMIDHKINGYLADYKSSEDLAFGISYILLNKESDNLSKNARKKAVDNYAEKIVANKYLELYESLQ